MKKPYQHFKKSSYLSAENLSYLEQNHSSFANLINGQDNEPVILKSDVVKSFQDDVPSPIGTVTQSDSTDEILAKVGYRFANLNPLIAQLDKNEIINELKK